MGRSSPTKLEDVIKGPVKRINKLLYFICNRLLLKWAFRAFDIDIGYQNIPSFYSAEKGHSRCTLFVWTGMNFLKSNLRALPLPLARLFLPEPSLCHLLKIDLRFNTIPFYSLQWEKVQIFRDDRNWKPPARC